MSGRTRSICFKGQLLFYSLFSLFQYFITSIYERMYIKKTSFLKRTTTRNILEQVVNLMVDEVALLKYY